MQRRRITLEDVALVLQFGEHREGQEEGTWESCLELEGRPVTVVYDLARYEQQGLYYIVTLLRRRCEE